MKTMYLTVQVPEDYDRNMLEASIDPIEILHSSKNDYITAIFDRTIELEKIAIKGDRHSLDSILFQQLYNCYIKVLQDLDIFILYLNYKKEKLL